MNNHAHVFRQLKNVIMVMSMILKRKTVFYKVMILIHYAHHKDHIGMSNHIHVMNAIIHNHSMIR